MVTARIKYLGGLRTETEHLRSGTLIQTDAPVDNNGRGELFSPTDLVAAALGSCMMTIMGIKAEKMRVDLTGSEMEVSKIMSAELPRRIIKIEITLRMVSGTELRRAQKDGLEIVALTCPVSLSLHPDIEQSVIFTWDTPVVA